MEKRAYNELSRFNRGTLFIGNLQEILVFQRLTVGIGERV